jgi:AraC-like DNA-binding protein
MYRAEDDKRKYITQLIAADLDICFCEWFDEKSPIWNFKEHAHDFLELIFFLEGKAEIRVLENVFKLKLFDLILYPPGLYHQEKLNSFFHQEIICLGFSYSADAVLSEPIHITDTSGTIRHTVEQIYFEYTQSDKRNAIVDSYIRTLFLLINRALEYSPIEAMDIPETARQYIHEHFNENISVNDICSRVSVSKSYLSRSFSARYGVAPMHYLNIVRIEAAKRLLTSSNMNISETGSRIGIGDAKYFSRLFKKITGFSPSLYKKRMLDS